MRQGANVLTLKAESPQPAGVLEPKTTEDRTVYCTVRSVSYRERYEAASHGLRPEIIVKLAAPEEYRGESLCEIEGVAFRVLHEYLTRDGGLELTLERRGRAP